MEQPLPVVTWSQVGERYALGRTEHGYGVFRRASGGPALVAAFAPGRAGWHAAWRRFNELEGTGAAGPGRAAPGVGAERVARLLAGSLLLLAVALGIAGLFPVYLGGASLASQGYQLLDHLLLLAGWAVAGALVLAGRRLALAGAALGAGVSALLFGLDLADLGTALSGTGGGTGGGTGLVLTLLGWPLAAAGSGLLLARRGPEREPAGTDPLPPWIGGLGLLLAAGAAVSFAPAWDRLDLLVAGGGSRALTPGDAFSGPALEVAGNLLFMVAAVVLVPTGLWWRRRRAGVALLAGGLVALAAQLLAAAVQAATPGSLGLPTRPGVTVTTSLTGWFAAYCAFVGALLLLAARAARPASSRAQARWRPR